ncbi:hypothetical protein FBEOM_5018 [Fusarium beomiforme]|uniref:LYR motif-containing protein Cup1-like N-terminal domain-containing protein n=1 Tax=Fusarium beomiforme TaxID=44412 RepID=A0A9P5ALZ7_9HYPO|nr:hypothetical protein FBEOM_5018 [Fusarium beomiforme]
MPRPHSTIPAYLPPLHLYRHILRETSYLPPAIRPAITSHIRTRFRNHRKHDRLQEKHRARAANLLRRLRAANSGKKSRMADFMMEAFGRTGARRRSLLSGYIRVESPSNSDALEALIQEVEANKKPPNTTEPNETKLQNKSSPHEPAETTVESRSSSNSSEGLSDALSGESEMKPKATLVRKGPKPLQPAFYEKWDTEKLRKLLHSQRQFQQSTRIPWPKTDVKSLNPDSSVPPKTIWGKPTPPNVYQAKRAHFWKRVSTKAMPPLESNEWDLLGRLTRGAQEQDQWKIPERRPAAKPVLAATPKSSTLNWDWEAYATRPAFNVDRNSPLSAYAFVGQDREKHPYQRVNSQELSPRWFRRAYQRVWQFTPKMDPRTKPDKPRFIWGSLTHPAVPATKAQLALFEGVNSKGEKLKAPKSKPMDATRPLDTPKS